LTTFVSKIASRKTFLLCLQKKGDIKMYEHVDNQYFASKNKLLSISKQY